MKWSFRRQVPPVNGRAEQNEICEKSKVQA